MSSTLCMQVKPKPPRSYWSFGLPVKAIFSGRYYDHDGSLGGGKMELTSRDLPFIQGALAAGNFDAKDRAALEKIAERLESGDTIEMWFEH